MEVEVKTAQGHAIVNVEATATFDNGAVLKSRTDAEGVARFLGAPRGVDGSITYEDEEDLIVRSFAANMHAAASESDERFMIQLLQSAVEFSAVDTVVQEVYGDTLHAMVESAFGSGDNAAAFEHLLARAGVAP